MSNFHPDTRGRRCSALFRLTCSVVLWGGRNTANKYHWRVWGVLAVYGPHWVCPSSRRCVFPGSTLLRLQVAQQGHCPKRALCFMYFPGLSCSGSGSRVPHRSTDSVGCVFVPFPGPSSSGNQVHGERTVPGGLCVLITSLVPATGFPGCATRSPSQVCHVSPLGS